MATTYRAIDWNPQKRRADLLLLAFVLGGLGLFAAITALTHPAATVETWILRGTALVALLLLHVILAIGPLARLDPRFLPLLYHRRHLGVTLFLLGLVHAVLATIQFHALGDVSPLVSLFTAYAVDARPVVHGHWNLAHAPFEPFGVAALVLLFLLAATSHDFWLRQLGPGVWKCLHLGAYLAYALLLAHVSLGVLQSERHPGYPLLLALGFVTLTGLHLAAARRRLAPPSTTTSAMPDDFCDAGSLADLPAEGRGRCVVTPQGNLALFRKDGRLFATSNVCRHQGGPLAEGRVIDGCITCPWHGWNYQPEDGESPPPFTERLTTHEVRLNGDRVQVRPVPLPPGTRSPGVPLP